MSKIINFIKNISPFNSRTDMPKFLYVIKVIIIFYAFKFMSELAGEAIAIGVHFACGKNPLQGDIFDADTIMLITYFGYAFMIGIVFLLWKLFQKKNISELGFTKNFGTYFIGMAVGAVLVMACVIPVVLAGAIQFNGVFSNINLGMVFLMIPAFILQGAMEEVLCRGVVQQLLARNASVPVAVGVSALLFTVVHVQNMDASDIAITAVAIINLVMISLIFSILTLRFRSLWAACGFHSVWNYILFNILGLNLSGKDEIVAAVFDMKSAGSNVINGGAYGIEASIVTTAVLAAALGLCIVLYRKYAVKKAELNLAC